MKLWYLSHRWPAKAQASMRIPAVSPEPSLFAHIKYGSRRRVRPKIRHLAPLDGCAWANVWRMSLRRTKSTIIWHGSYWDIAFESVWLLLALTLIQTQALLWTSVIRPFSKPLAILPPISPRPSGQSDIIIWTASSEFGTYHLCEQRRFRRACASAQSRQNLRCSLIQAVSQEEPSDRKPDPWPLWMAGHAQLKFVITESSKTQIRLTGLVWAAAWQNQHIHLWLSLSWSFCWFFRAVAH